MKKLILALSLIVTMPSFAHEHLITLESQYSPKETAERYASLVVEKGLTLFAQIDHSANASSVDLELAPTELILFGNPKVGTLLMQCASTAAIDLPQKALVWEDSDGTSKLAYTNPAYLKELHNIVGCDAVLEKVTALLSDLAATATGNKTE